MSLESTIGEELKSVGTTLWWLLLLRSITTIIFGILVLAWPTSTIAALLLVFGFFSIFEGIIEVGVGLIGRATQWGWAVFNGIVGIVLGVLVIRYPGTALWVLLMFISAWALVSGFFMIFGAFGMKEGSRFWSIISGVINVVFGLVLLFNPVGGGRALWWVIGIYAVVLGTVMLVTALVARREVKALLSS